MENSVAKVTTIIGLAAFSILAAFKLSDSLISKGIVTDKNMAILLTFFAVFAVSIVITAMLFKTFLFSKNNNLTVIGGRNKTNQDTGNRGSNSRKRNILKVRGNNNETNQDTK